MTLVINALGLILIGLIIWWFWLKKSGNEATVTDQTIEITVDNGIYSPDTIKAKSGQPVKLRFIRKTENPCAKTIIFNELNISHELPFNEPYDIELQVDKPGKYSFTCEMAMYRGKLIVE